MKFWDASAVVPLLVAEPTTRALQELALRDPEMLVWWGTEIECASALSRLERAASLNSRDVDAALQRMRELSARWHEILPSEILRETALRFLRVHALRAADALQLAAAFVAAEHRPASLEIVTFDDRLADAARREGFVLVDQLEE